MTAGAALRFVGEHPVALFNVKLMKVGGIQAAHEICGIAAAGRKRVMIGCMDEAALAIVAGLHLALSSPVVAYADLDGHIAFEGDPTTDALILRDGRLRPSDAPGLGLA